MDPEDSIASVFTTSSPTTTVAPLSVTMDSFDLPTEPVPNSPLLQPISSDSNNGLTDPDMVSLESPPPAGVGSGYEFGALIDQHSSSSSQISSAIVPKSPVKTIVRAHLGDHGHTFVSTKPGITVREALSKAMKLRKLTPETCAVYNCSDPTKVTTIFFKSCDFFLLLNSWCYRHPSPGTGTFPRSRERRLRWKSAISFLSRPRFLTTLCGRPFSHWPFARLAADYCSRWEYS